MALKTSRLWGTDFDGPFGAKPDPTIFGCRLQKNYEQGTKNLYHPDNVFLDGLGHGIIEARQEVRVWNGQTFQYTSGAFETIPVPLHPIRTTPAGNWEVAAVVKIPHQKGAWPAGPWFLGANWNWDFPPGVPHPQCGEIDNDEHYAQARNQIRFNIVRADGSWSSHDITLPFNVDEGFHEYKTQVLLADTAKDLGYNEGVIRCIIDGKVYYEVFEHEIFNWKGTYDQPFEVICQVEIGGNNGDPDATTQWPIRMEFDSIWCSGVTIDVTQPAPQPAPIPGGKMVTADKAIANDGNWNADGTDRYAWAGGRWIDFLVDGPFDSLMVTVKQRTNPQAPHLPPGFSFKLDVSVDSSPKGQVVIPAQEAPAAMTSPPFSGVMPLSIPAGQHKLRLSWPSNNDPWDPVNGFDPNLQLVGIELVQGSIPAPDARARAEAKLKSPTWTPLTDDEAAAL